ncbi:MAG: lactonase family protein, partial [Runella slithyformis]
MKKTTFFLLAIWGITYLPVFSQTTDCLLFVGTYTTSTSEGIYVYRFNTLTGEATPVRVAKGIKNPSFQAISPNKRLLYSVAEMNGGAVSAFAIDPKTG